MHAQRATGHGVPRWSVAVIAAVLALGGAIVTAVTLGDRAAATEAALLVTPTGSDRSACTREEPCAGLARAYAVAAPGQVVDVAEGFYPRQTIVWDGSKGRAEPVVLRAAPGASVVLDGLQLGTGVTDRDGPRSVIVRDMRIADRDGQERTVAAFAGTQDVALENLDAANFYLNGVRRFTVRGGDWGPCTSSGDEVADGCSNSKIDASPDNDRITIEGALFHDYRIVPGSGAHFECLFVAGGTRISVRDSTFRDCDFYDVFVQHSGVPINRLRIERNHFDTPWNGAGSQHRATALAFSPRGMPFGNVLVGRNTFAASGIAVNDDGDGTRYSNFRVEANRGRSYGCDPAAEYVANVWDAGPACSPTDRSASR